MSCVVEANGVQGPVPVRHGSFDFPGRCPAFLQAATGSGGYAGRREDNGDGMGNIQRGEIGIGRQPQEDRRVRHLLLGQTALLGAEDEGDARAGPDALQKAGQVREIERSVSRPAAQGRGRHDNFEDGDGLRDRLEAPKAFESVVGPGRQAARLFVGGSSWLDHAQVADTEVL